MLSYNFAYPDFFPGLSSKLSDTFKRDSFIHTPRISKVCLNVGIGNAKHEEKLLDACVRDLGLISGQKAVVTFARKSISSFKLREGFPVGCKVTLRKRKMINFLARLLYVALPDEKDFLGFLSSSLTSDGNLSFGIREHIIFPEIDYDKIYKIFGFNATIVTTAKTSADAKLLLQCFGFPFKD